MQLKAKGLTVIAVQVGLQIAQLESQRGHIGHGVCQLQITAEGRLGHCTAESELAVKLPLSILQLRQKGFDEVEIAEGQPELAVEVLGFIQLQLGGSRTAHGDACTVDVRLRKLQAGPGLPGPVDKFGRGGGGRPGETRQGIGLEVRILLGLRLGRKRLHSDGRRVDEEHALAGVHAGADLHVVGGPAELQAGIEYSGNRQIFRQLHGQLQSRMTYWHRVTRSGQHVRNQCGGVSGIEYREWVLAQLNIGSGALGRPVCLKTEAAAGTAGLQPAVQPHRSPFRREQQGDGAFQLPAAGDGVDAAAVQAAVPDRFFIKSAGEAQAQLPIVGGGLEAQLMICRLPAEPGEDVLNLQAVLRRAEAGVAYFQREGIALVRVTALQQYLRYADFADAQAARFCVQADAWVLKGSRYGSAGDQAAPGLGVQLLNGRCIQLELQVNGLGVAAGDTDAVAAALQRELLDAVLLALQGKAAVARQGVVVQTAFQRLDEEAALQHIVLSGELHPAVAGQGAKHDALGQFARIGGGIVFVELIINIDGQAVLPGDAARPGKGARGRAD